MIEDMSNEQGDIIILFAVVLIILLALLGLSTDVILAFNEKDRLDEICATILEARLDLGQELWNSMDANRRYNEIAREVATRNGLNPNQVKVKWEEVSTQWNRREVELEIVVKSEYKCNVISAFGIKKLPIVSKTNRKMVKGDRVKIWNPRSFSY